MFTPLIISRVCVRHVAVLWVAAALACLWEGGSRLHGRLPLPQGDLQPNGAAARAPLLLPAAPHPPVLRHGGRRDGLRAGHGHHLFLLQGKSLFPAPASTAPVTPRQQSHYPHMHASFSTLMPFPLACLPPLLTHKPTEPGDSNKPPSFHSKVVGIPRLSCAVT